MEYCSYSSNFLGCLALFSSAIVVVFFILRRSGNTLPKHRRPPGPPAWPIVGNIFDLGNNPPRNLYKLGFKYGPVVWLKLGYINTLVVQSAKAAEELFKKHDNSFCDRKISQFFTVYDYHKSALAPGRYGSRWRFHRKIVTLELMTAKRVCETASIRRKCIDDMIQYIEKDAEEARARGESGELVISYYVFIMAFNLIGNLAFSRDLLNSRSEEGSEFFDAMNKTMNLAGKPNIADFFPFLQRLDPQRIEKNTKLHMGRTMDLVERFMKERIEERKLMDRRETRDFLDALLELKGDVKEETHEITTHSMLIMILEMFFGGTETTSSTLEWVMAELFRRPESMRRVKEELGRVVGPKGKVEESDIDELPYLQAVIKEALRLHPVVPLLVPRNTTADTTFMGYLIPKETQVFVNVWAIGRDPDSWEDPLSFKPERFLGSDIDYRGQNFELLPFGSGRRICVGIPLAHRILHLALASLLHCFDWELGGNSTPESIDMKERFGITSRKLVPIKAIPKKIVQEP